jgi:hypothetical protein
MRKKSISIGIALIAMAIFLLVVLSPRGCGFNMLPYLIHESIAPGGSGETIFIWIFDIVFGSIVCYVIYLLLTRLTRRSRRK